MKASELRPNPRNWRTHPQAQQDALRGVLAEVGYADALLARELPDGGLELVDGHLRAETTPEQEVPVLVVDLTEDEAYKVLATLDPLAAMAEASQQALGELLAGLQTSNEAVQGGSSARPAGAAWGRRASRHARSKITTPDWRTRYADGRSGWGRSTH